MTAKFMAWFGAIQLVWLGLFFDAPWWLSLLPTELLAGAVGVLVCVAGFDLRKRRIAARRFAMWRERNREVTGPAVSGKGVSMTLTANIEQARLTQVPQILNGLKASIEGFFVLGMHTLDHPVAGLASELTEWHTTVEKAIDAHNEHMGKVLTPTVKLDFPKGSE